MLELIGAYIVISWLFSHPLVIAAIFAFLVIGAIGAAISEREDQPVTKELRGMTYEQRRQWANREGPYA